MYRRILLSIVLGAVLPLAAPAFAGPPESVAMPFECMVDGARIVMRPSEPRSYPVIGEREERQVTACTSPGATDCRTLIAHRFQISCGGRRVAWMRVVAAARRGPSRQMWIEGGRIHLAVEPRAGTAQRCGDPRRMMVGRYASGAGASRFGLPLAECLPWQRERSIAHVALPPGFAPIGEIGARLLVAGSSATQPSVVAALPPERVDRVPALPPSAPPPVVEAVPRIERAIETTPPPPVAAEPQPPATAIPVVLTGAEQPRTWVTMVSAEMLPEQPRFARGPSAQVWLAATLLAALLAICAWAMWRSERPASEARMDRRMRGLRARMRTAASHATAAEATAVPSSATSITNAAASVTALIDQANGSINVLAGAPPLREVLEQELGVIRQRLAIVKAQASEGPEAAHRSAPAFRSLVRDLERVRRISESAALSFSSGRIVTRLPRTRSEAYDVLGVHADVSAETLKKLVDALRMCWHPDLARDEPDRLNREERIKCINVAWELISGKRAVA